MENIELYVETAKGRTIFFVGPITGAFVVEQTETPGHFFTLFLYDDSIRVASFRFGYYPTTLTQQLLQQGVLPKNIFVRELDIEEQQALLDQNTLKQ